jgi:outer membrane protein assembly factor BamA
LIVGNTRTPTRTILDAIPIYPGHVLRQSDLRATEHALEQLGCFVVDPRHGIRPNATILDTKNEFKDVLITVEEKEEVEEKATQGSGYYHSDRDRS